MRGRARMTAVGACAFLVTVAFAAPGAMGGQETDFGAAAALQQAILRAKEKVLPAVVNIQPVTEVYVAGTKRKVTAVGSGIIYSPRGYVITNYHVAGKAKRLICTLVTKERVPARLIGGDPYTDLAVIQLDLDRLRGTTLTWATLGDSDAVQTGEFVLALGSPLALSHSLSVGVVSAKNRYFPDARTPTGETTGSYNTWIQTDAAINFGNSGGPLVNLRGEVIGINARKSRWGENLGFAIPINVAKDVAQQLVAHKKVTRSWLGLRFQPLQDFEEYFTAEGTATVKGVLVRNVQPGSPADQAGVRAGDIITRFGKRNIDARFYEAIPPLRRLIARTPIGTRVSLRVLRGGRSTMLTAVTQELGRQVGADFECKAWGLTVKTVTPETARRAGLGDPRGVTVTGVKSDSPASKASLGAGDIIIEVNRKAVKGLSDFRTDYGKAVAAKPERVVLKVWRGGGVYYRLLKFERKETSTKPVREPTTKPAPRPQPTSRPTTRPAGSR